MNSTQFLSTSTGNFAIDMNSLEWKKITIDNISSFQADKTKLAEFQSSFKDIPFEQRLLKDEYFSNNAKIHILPSYNCNYKCSYCYENPRKKITSCLSPKHINNILEFYALYNKSFNVNANISAVTVSGGEPFLSENYKVIHSILETWKNIPITFITNGSCIKNYFNLLNKYDNIAIAFSIDGTKDMHYKYRHPSKSDDYEELIKAIRSAIYFGYNIQLSALFQPEFESLYPSFFDLLETLGWIKNKKIHFAFSLKSNGGGMNDYSKKYLHESIDAMLRLKKADKRTDYIDFKSIIPGCTQLVEAIENEREGKYIPYRCYIQNSPSFTFLPNGNVSFCSCIDTPLSQVGTFGETVSIDTNKILNIRNRSYEKLTKCKSCLKRSLCRGECLATAIKKTNSYDSPYCGIWEDDYLFQHIDSFL